MSFASHVTMWEERGAMMSRIQTNLSANEFVSRLAQCGRPTAAEAVEEHQDLLRLNGGPYLIVRWARGVTRDEVQAIMLLREDAIREHEQPAAVAGGGTHH